MFHFLSGGVKQTTKISHFVDFDWEKYIEMAWGCEFRVWDVPNPMALVSGLYDKWFLKIKSLGDK